MPGPPRRTDRYSSGPYFTGWTIPPPPLIAVADLPFPDLGCLPGRFPTGWLLKEGWLHYAENDAFPEWVYESSEPELVELLVQALAGDPEGRRHPGLVEGD